MSMKPSKFDIFYWWGLLFSSIPLIIIFIGLGVAKTFITSNKSVEKIIVTEIINIEQEPEKVVEKVIETKKVIVKPTVQDTEHHTVQDTVNEMVTQVSDTTKKVD